MGELRELAERCEAATAGYQRRLLSEAYREIFGGPECITIDRWPGYQSPRWDAFHKKLEAEAFLDAAMTLVPEGWFLNGVYENGEGKTYATLRKCNVGDVHGSATTPALALCAAALRAREEGNE
jgi:hypothetical protein